MHITENAGRLREYLETRGKGRKLGQYRQLLDALVSVEPLRVNGPPVPLKVAERNLNGGRPEYCR